MKNILVIALSQLRIQFAQRGILLSQFVVPIIMMIAIGAFTGQSRIQTDEIDILHAGDALAVQFAAELRKEGQKVVEGNALFNLCDLTAPAEQPAACQLSEGGPLTTLDEQAAAAQRRVDNRQTLAFVRLPVGFTDDLKAGRNVQIQVTVQSGNAALSQTIRSYVDAVRVRLSGAIIVAEVVAAKANTPAAFETAFNAAQAAWATDPVVISESVSTLTGTSPGSGFSQSAPGVGAMFVMFNALTLMQIFVTERKQWTMQRLIMMPLTRAQILAGKMIGQYVLGLITFGVMIVAGLVLGVPWGNWAAVIVVVVVYTLTVTALGLAVSTFARTVNQAGSLYLLIPMVLSPLGGAWWPLDIMPPVMQTIGKIISPIAWSQSAFTQIVHYGAGVPEVLPQVGVLLLFAAVYFGIGLLRFRLD